MRSAEIVGGWSIFVDENKYMRVVAFHVYKGEVSGAAGQIMHNDIMLEDGDTTHAHIIKGKMYRRSHNHVSTE